MGAKEQKPILETTSSESVSTPWQSVSEPGYAIYALYTEESGTLSGTMHIEASCDGINPVVIEESVRPLVAGGDYELWNVALAFYPYARLVVTLVSGTIGIKATITQKRF